MNPSPTDPQTAAIALLSRGEPLTAAQIGAALRCSQATVSGIVAGLGARVHRLGAARSTRYALTQDIMGLAAVQPLTWTDASGRMEELGTLAHLAGGRVTVKLGKRDWVCAPGQLPWFLTPLRPQGFLGRAYGALRPDFPSDPDAWTLQQVLFIAALYQGDPPGAISLGEIKGRLVDGLVDEVSVDLPERLAQYDQRAKAVGQGLPAGSSAGGEQPKFLAGFASETAAEAWQHSIVKFSPPLPTPFGKRWRALLMLEALALQVLSEHGIAAAQAQAVQSSQRCYLESLRFDRVGHHGKRHVVSIEALHKEFVATPRRHWVATAEALAAQGLIEKRDLHTIASVYAFGQLIGNTDMHFGNLGFFADSIEKPKFQLAPIYDMLPMMWRPNVHAGDFNDDPVREQPLPIAHPQACEQARDWAITFWQRAAELDISPGLQAACAESAKRVAARFAR